MDFRAMITPEQASDLTYELPDFSGMLMSNWDIGEGPVVMPSLHMECSPGRFHKLLKDTQATLDPARVQCSTIRDVAVLTVHQTPPILNDHSEAILHMYISAWHKE